MEKLPQASENFPQSQLLLAEVFISSKKVKFSKISEILPRLTISTVMFISKNEA